MSHKPDLKAILAKWQQRLRLEDWRISIQWASDKRLRQLTDNAGEDDSISAFIQFYTRLRTATVYVCTPSSYEGPSTRNIEVDVLHELLHAMLREIIRPDTGELEEIIVNKLAGALVG